MAEDQISGLTSEEKRALLEQLLAEEQPADPDSFPLSFSQQRLWFLQQLEPGSAAYNIPRAVRLCGDLDLAALTRSFAEMVRRHESLRTLFRQIDAEPLQVVLPRLAVPLPEVDLRRLSAPEREAEAARWIEAAAQQPFDLATGPLVRVTLFRTGDRESILLVILHHIVSDGWSAGIFIQEMVALYQAFSRGLPSPLPDLPVQYVDYALSQRDWLQGESFEEMLAYWRERLRGAPAVLELPADHPRPPVQGDRGAVERVALAPGLSRRVREESRRLGATQFMTLLAAFAALLHRYTGQTDIVVGSPVANRTQEETEGLIGFFVNTLVLRTDLSGDPSFAGLVARVREVTLEAYAHQDLPFERLVEELRPERNRAYNPLFQIELALLNTPAASTEGAGLSVLPVEVPLRAAKFDLSLLLGEVEGDFRGLAEYSTDLFEPATVRRLLGHYALVLRAGLERPGVAVAELPLLAEAERQQVLVEWNDSAAALPGGEPTFVEIFSARAAAAPEAVAAADPERVLTYGELDRRTGRLAALLAAEGVAAGDVIPLLAARSTDFLIAVLAIFKAGAAYLPLDPLHPAARQAQILDACGAATVLCERRAAPALTSPRILVLEDLLARASAAGAPPPPARDGGLAYLIYTSGSTGVPKGAMLDHRGMLNHLYAKVSALELTVADTVAQTASQCFDISVWQLLAPLLAGGRVQIYPDEVTHDPLRLAGRTDADGVTILELVPSLLRILLEELSAEERRPPFARLRWLIPTGEALPPELCRQWLELYPAIPLLNAYGPTECSDDVTHHPIAAAPGPAVTRMPIGRPVPNLRLYVVDRRFQPQPTGIPGELCVGGAGVGRGYLGDGARTAQAFLPDPFAGRPGQRLYRTGDLARWRTDGRLEYLGRIDHQVKIRGHRIELGEIDAVLSGHPLLRTAVVLAREDSPGDRRLVAYVVPRAETLPPRELVSSLRDFLARRLPESMIPGAFVTLEDLPLSPNGKLDRAALPAPDPGHAAPAFVPLQGPTEELVAAIWAAVLGREPIGARDDFFDLGGHSLLATQVTSRVRSLLRVELPLRALFEDPTVAGLARRIERERGRDQPAQAPPLRPARRDGDLPLSFAQQRLWFLDQLQPGSPLYNIPLALRLAGPLHRGALAAGLGEIVARHESLRTTFHLAGEQPVQRIAPPGAWALPQVDLRALPEDRRSSESHRLAGEEARRPFDLALGPPLRATLVRLAEDEHAVLLTLHHIVADGWSVGVLTRELAALYPALAAGSPSPLSPLPLQYSDFAVWQRSWLQGETLEREIAFWREHLAGAPDVLELPTDRPRPPVATFRGAQRRRLLAAETGRAVHALARREGATPFMILLTALGALLARSSGQPDVVVASAIANRHHEEIEDLIGFFVNTLALRIRTPEGESFAGVLAAVRETTLSAYAHQDLPFEKLIDALDLPRELSVNPLCQVMLTYQNLPPAAERIPGLEITSPAGGAVETGTAKFDLAFFAREDGPGLATLLEHNTDLFDAPTAERILGHLEVLLAGAAAHPQTRIADLPLLSEPERQSLLAEWNDTGIRYPATPLLHELVAAQAARTPDAPALLFAERRLTYRELDARANALARRLRALGGGPDVPVGVLMERCPEMVVALLSVLKAGSPYLAIDPEHPAERIGWMLTESRAPVVLAQPALLSRLPAHDATVLCLEAGWGEDAGPDGEPAPPGAAAADHLAYVLYTSGSTGRPKGVMIPHRGIVNRLLWAQETYGLRPDDRVLQKTPFGFDVSVWELFWPLTTGACLVVAQPGGHRDPGYLAGLIAHTGVTVLHFVPSMLQTFLAHPDLTGCGRVRLVICSGEALSPELRLRCHERLAARLENLYGPTEASVEVTWWSCSREALRGSVPIGRPLANTRIRILDRGARLVPPGSPGELHIGGVQLARGYLGRPELTAEAFIPDPFGREAGERLYRTGDLARWLPDGTVEYLGRIDHQIKIRGFRIELGEIEAALLLQPEVREAVVVARQDGPSPRLVAYVVPAAGEEARPAVLREALLARIPAYMVPAAWVVLPSLPLTANGKVDRRALPEPEAASGGALQAEPRTPVEQVLAGIWAEVLLAGKVGRHDNFFAFGGDSILSIQICARAQRAGVLISPRLLFQHQTIAELAAVANTAGAVEAEQGLVTGPVPLTPIQRWFFAGDPRAPHHFNQSVLFETVRPLNPPLLRAALGHLERHHDALRLRFDLGPAGWQQTGSLPGPHVPLTVLDLAALPASRRPPAVAAAAAQAQSGLALDSPPLYRALLLDLGPQEPGRFFWTIHHLAVDGVSWRFLLEDLAALHDGAGLPAKTTSFRRWAERLAGQADAAETEAELAGWLGQPWAAVSQLPLDRAARLQANTAASEETVSLLLDEEETGALLKEVPQAYNTRINDALLTALALGCRDWTGAPVLLLDLEGHGREEIFPDVDLSRTVGWFTSIYPVLLDLREAHDPGAALKAVKEQLRRVPRGGLGHGLLRWASRHATTLAALPRPEVVFNYLGQLDQALPPGSPFRPAREAAGSAVSPAERRRHLLEITGGVFGGRLRLTCTFSANVHRPGTIQRLMEAVAGRLRELIAHGRAPEVWGCTPSDFPLTGLDQEQLDALLAVQTPAARPGTRRPIEDVYPLSPMQQGMLFQALYAPDAGAYVDQLLVRLHGPLDPEVVQEAWRRVVQHNPVLRASFHWQGMDRPLQVVHAAVPVVVEREDWSALPDAGREARLAELMESDRVRGFDLAQAPPMRWRLIRTGDDEHAFLWTHHHILLDGWSFSLVLADFVAAAIALRDGREPDLPHRRPFRDYIAWLGGQDPAGTEDYWRRALAGWSEPTPLGMAASLPGRSGIESRRSWLSSAETAELQAQARRHELTLNTLVQAAWGAFLAHTSGHLDVVFGATVSGRPDLAGADTMVGLFINTLPVRVRADARTGLPAALHELQRAQAELRQHEHSPLVQVQGWSEVPRGRSLFESLLVFENYPRDASLGSGGAELGVTGVQAVEHTSYPLNALVVPGERLVLDLEYDRARFDDATMLRTAGHVRNLLAGLAARLRDGGAGTLLDLPLLSDAERHQICLAWNDTGTGGPSGCVHELFERQVRRTPRETAVVFGTESLTYAELGARAGRLARRLRRLGVGPDVLVGLLVERSLDMIVGVLGILQAGGAYVPLDPRYPADRLAFMLADTRSPVLLTQAGLLDRLPAGGSEVVLLDRENETAGEDAAVASAEPSADNLAYVIYTSGSTGRPKGVALSHLALRNLIDWHLATLLGGVAALQFASLSFDASFHEMFACWGSGGTLVVVPDELRRDMPALADLLVRQRVEKAILPVVVLQQLAEIFAGRRELPPLREITTTGERLQTDRAMAALRRRLPGCSFHNHYGPSETHVATAYTLSPDPEEWAVQPSIGRPLWNTRVYVLDPGLAPAPLGFPGDLYIGGVCLARGYLGRPDLTAQRFVPDPFSGEPGARLYRTGDKVRLPAHGDLEYLGRFDDQVKIRGFRIEPGEIEAALAEHGEVRESAVLVTEDPVRGRSLVACVAGQARAAELRGFLLRRLPDYMVPSRFVLFDALPLTVNGKVDRRALAGLVAETASGETPDSGPQTPLEEIVTGVWAAVLGCDRVRADESFFELGGHSLLATRVISRLNRACGVDLPIRALFDHPTARALAAVLARAMQDGSGLAVPPIGRAARDREIPLSFAQERLWFLDRLDPDGASYNIATALRLAGRLDVPALVASFHEILLRHESLRTTFSLRPGGRPVQVIGPPPDRWFRLVDLEAVPAASRDGEVARLIAAESRRPFDLRRGPVLRAVLLRLGDDDHVLSLVVHHIAADDWSIGIFVSELTALYSAFARSERPRLPELPLQYADFAVWQRSWLAEESEVMAGMIAAWRTRLAGAPAALELPTDRLRAPVQTFRGGVSPFRLGDEATAALRRLARAEGATLFMAALAGFETLLHRSSGQDDLVVGSPVAGRNREEIEGLIGVFINLLALRGTPSGGLAFRELVSQAREAALDAYRLQDLPFEKLVEEIKPERDLARTPLFQVVLVLQNAAREDLALPGLTLTQLAVETGTAKYELLLSLVEQPGGLAGSLEYNTGLFDPATAARLLSQLATLLAAAAAEPDRRLGDLPLLAAAERQQILVEWNDTAEQPSAAGLLHRCFTEQAGRDPEAVAVVHGEERWTYRELRDRSLQLAGHLRRTGIGPEVRVGVCLERSPDLLVALLGTLAAGGAYVPLDPTYPSERLSYMLEDSGAALLLSQRSLLGRVADLAPRVVLVDGGWEGAPMPDEAAFADPAQLAYVIYTSGSTGRPKGVGIAHRSAVALVDWARNAFPARDLAGVLAATSVCFDLSVFEIFVPLSCGGKVILAANALALPGLPAAGEVTLVNTVPSAIAELARAGGIPASVRTVHLAGEPLKGSLVREVYARSSACQVLNLYGPTEDTTYSTWCRADGAGEPHIGRPLPGTRAFVLDAGLRALPPGVPGELHLGGAGLARGYLGRPDRTAASFVPDPFGPQADSRLYRTGDLARWRPDGALELLGRLDHQVKVRGFRIEPGEVETALAALPGVRETAVLALGEGIRRRLAAFVVPAADGAVDVPALRQALRERLPEPMVPSDWHLLPALPLSPNGKVDRLALARLGSRPAPAPGSAPGDLPRTRLERLIAAAWCDVLGIGAVGHHDNFFDLGGHSLLLVRLQETLRISLDREVPLVDLFRHPTVDALARSLAPNEEDAPAVPSPAASRAAGGDARIAIIGMSGRFPGAAGVEELWHNLCAGVESVVRLSDEELLAAGVDPETLRNPRYVRASAPLEGVDLFDAEFFGFTPRDAEITDPQHRLFLECAWEAIENGGYDPARFGGRIGVYAGVRMSGYLVNLYTNPEVLRSVGTYKLDIANDKDHLPTTVSYKLDLRGPSMAVQTACSSSLVAAHQACRSLIAKECDMALAGGAALLWPLRTGYVHQEGGILSPDGHCRAFDAQAQGTVGGSGAGVVLLKRLADALADGDTIHAVILGSAVNNDGSLKVGYTAPSVDGQAQVIAEALAAGGVDPRTVTYVEAHGTGTPLGDPIELAALTQAFRTGTGDRGFCALGSMKTNLGHLDTAAGIAGLIKTSLALERGQLPPTLHFTAPNPKIDFAASPFFVNDRLTEWKTTDGPRRAGVSSFGIGGTNAHMVLEEPPAAEPGSPPRHPWQLLVLSARTQPALEAAAAGLHCFLNERPETDLADAAWTLQTGRRAFRYRRAVLCRDVPEALAALAASGDDRSRDAGGEEKGVAFLFPGQGAQHPGMGLGLYRSEPVFRSEVDRAAELLRPQLGRDLRDLLASGEEETALVQPALFAVEHALARLWMSWGIRPVAMLGHSLGEYVAACLAGVFSFEDGLALVAERGRLLGGMPRGSMVSVPLPEDALSPLLAGGLALAAVNGPAQCVVAGPEAEIRELIERLAAGGVEGRRLRTSHAFHSAMMEPAVDLFAAAVGRVRLSTPRIPWISNVTGTWITDAEATDPGYWARHLRATVRFADGLAALLRPSQGGPSPILLEVGPGKTLSALARRHPDRPAAHLVASSLPHPDEGRDDAEAALSALGQLWTAGAPVDWQALHQGERRRRIPLPTYPFERRRFWIEPGQGIEREDGRAAARRELADWFSTPFWRPAPPVPAGGDALGPWLVFLQKAGEAGEAGFGGALLDHLRRLGAETVVVPLTERLRSREDYDVLLSEIAWQRGSVPPRILHLGSDGPPTPAGDFAARLAGLEREKERGFYSLLFLLQALGDRGSSERFEVTVVTSASQRVAPGDLPCPERAMALSLCRVAPRENAGITCRAIDVELPPRARWLGRIAAEIASSSAEPLTAWRGGERWVPDLAPVRIEEPAPRREEEVWLVTGGLGGLGLEIAEHLALSRARLVLLGRAGLPPEEEWDRWLAREEVASPEPSARLSQREIELRSELGVRGVASRPGAQEALDAFASARLLHFLIEAGIEIRRGAEIHLAELRSGLRLLPKFDRFLDFLLDVLAEDGWIQRTGDEVIFQADAGEAPDPALLARETVSRHPALRPILARVERCAAGYGPALSGEAEALGLLFSGQDEGEPAEALSHVPVYTRLATEVAVRAAERCAAQGRALRVLEVGGGQGMLTRRLAPALAGRGAEYWFTDLGRMFVTEAEREAERAGLDFLRFGLLDASRDPVEQGYEAESFDLVFAVNVVHATPDVVETLRHLRRLLRPGGSLCLIELTRRQRWMDMIWGLADGWWSFSDSFRQGSPLLGVEQWREVLARAGYDIAAALPEDLGGRADADCSLLLATRPATGEISGVAGRIARVRRLRALGAEVVVEPANVADPAALRAVAHRAVERFGRVDGVVHAVGVPGGGLLGLRTRESLEEELSAKVQGTLAIGEVCREISPGYLVLFSSISALTGQLGQAGYCAANAFLDAWAHVHAAETDTTTLAIDWDRWQGVGMAAAVERRHWEITGEQLAGGIAPTEGVEAFARALASGYPQLVVSPADLTARLAPAPEGGKTPEPAQRRPAAASIHERPSLASEYVPPADALEQEIAEIWQEVFGIQRIGIHDDFFELGGDSLVALQLVSRLSKATGIELRVRSLFDTPTIAALAVFVEETILASASQEELALDREVLP